MKTKKPRCQFFLSLSPDLVTIVKKGVKNLPNKISNKVLSLDQLDPQTEILGLFTDSKVTKEVLKKLPNLKAIITFSTGFDHIDFTEVKKRGIVVCNVPSYGDYTVAQHTLTLILALSKKLFESVKRVKEGHYDYHGMRGFDLRGKTIGIIGTGKIGKAVVKMLAGFEMNIQAYDPYPDKEFAKVNHFKYVPLNTLLKTSDIVSLHVPLLKNTKHLLNKTNLKIIKPGAFVINTSRGGLVDGEALYNALQSGRVAGAGLDVLEDEEIMRDPVLLFSEKCEECTIRTSLINNLLIDHPRTIVTPHNAFNTTEAILRIINTSLENLDNFVKGKPTNIVAPKP